MQLRNVTFDQLANGGFVGRSRQSVLMKKPAKADVCLRWANSAREPFTDIEVRGRVVPSMTFDQPISLTIAVVSDAFGYCESRILFMHIARDIISTLRAYAGSAPNDPTKDGSQSDAGGHCEHICPTFKTPNSLPAHLCPAA
jgi:hypothetical protein